MEENNLFYWVEELIGTLEKGYGKDMNDIVENIYLDIMEVNMRYSKYTCINSLKRIEKKMKEAYDNKQITMDSIHILRKIIINLFNEKYQLKAQEDVWDDEKKVEEV